MRSGATWALLPQFVAPGDPPIVRVLQLAVLFDVIGLTWLLTYSAMLGAVGAGLDRPGPRRLIRWLTGTVLVGFGARVALERAPRHPRLVSIVGLLWQPASPDQGPRARASK